MLDDFFIRALLAGMGIAAVAGPLGCFVIWRRMAYFGDTLSHSALLGVTLAFLFDIAITLSVFAVAALVALLLLFLQRRKRLSSDTLLGILAHSALALGLVTLGLLPNIRVDLMGFLFGDILSVNATDLLIIYFGGAVVLLVIARFWTDLLASTVNVDISAAEGARPRRAELILTLLTALVIAVAIKIVGALLITAILIIPAAAARQFARSPEQMAMIAALIGVLAMTGGLFGSLTYDTASGPSVVLAAAILFGLSISPLARWLGGKRR